MANKEDIPWGTPQEHALFCKNTIRCLQIQYVRIVKILFVLNVSKKNHKDHDRDIITSDFLREFNSWMKKYSLYLNNWKKSRKCVKIFFSRIHWQYDAMVENLIRLGSSMKYYNLANKKSDLSKVRSSLEEKKKIVLQCVISLKKTTVVWLILFYSKSTDFLPNSRLSKSTESSTNF